MPETEKSDEINELSEEETNEDLDELEQFLRLTRTFRIQEYIDELAQEHPNGSSFAKKALRNPEAAAESWKFRRKIRSALRYAAIPYKADLPRGEELDKETLAEIRADLMDRYIETIKKQPKRKSKAFRRAAMLSAALHLAPVAVDRYERVVEQEIPNILTIWGRRISKVFMETPEIDEEAKVRQILDTDGSASPEEAETQRKAIEDLIIFSPDKARELVLSGEIKLEKTWINHGRFFLLTEHLDGTSKEDTEKNMNALEQLKKEIRADLKKERYLSEYEQVQTIHKYMSRYGMNNIYRNFYMGDLLTSPKPHKGNCEARGKLALTVVNDIPELGVEDIRLQFMEIHVRVLFKMKSGRWYAIDNGVFELPDADISGTAMMDRYAYIRGYLGIQPKVRVLDQNKDIKRRMTLNEMLLVAFALGARSYLNAGGVPGLRSTFDLVGPSYPKEQTEDKEYEVEIVEIDEETVEKEGITEGYAEAQKKLKKKQETEEKKYRIPRDKLKNARITGEIALKGKDVNDLSQLKTHEVTTLTLDTASVTDFSPLSETPLEELNLNFMVHPVDLSKINPRKLRILRLIKTKLEDRRLLKKAPLQILQCYQCGIEDLSEVNLDSLRSLNLIGHGQASIDLAPLQGKPIQELLIRGIQPINLQALAGSQIHSLGLSELDFSEIDTTALSQMPLKWADLSNSKVSDISFLKGLPIEEIHLGGTDVSDVNLLTEMPLKKIGLGEKMRDLRPIKHILDKLRGKDGISVPLCFQINWDNYQLEPVSGEKKPKFCN